MGFDLPGGTQSSFQSLAQIRATWVCFIPGWSAQDRHLRGEWNLPANQNTIGSWVLMNLDIPVASENPGIRGAPESYISRMSRSTSGAANSGAHRSQGHVHRKGWEQWRLEWGKPAAHLKQTGSVEHWQILQLRNYRLSMARQPPFFKAIWIFALKYK